MTDDFGDVSVAFTNGILSTQNLRKQLNTPKGVAPTKKDIDAHIGKEGDSIREFLAGDVLPALRSLFERAEKEGATVHLALYELEDKELLGLLVKHQKRLQIILSTAGSTKPKKGSGDPAKWDTTNAKARAKLRGLMGNRLQNRMFNNSAHIGHNKFVVLSRATARRRPSDRQHQLDVDRAVRADQQRDRDGGRRSAQAYLEYWKRLNADKLPTPSPLSAPMASNQGAALRTADAQSKSAALDGRQRASRCGFRRTRRRSARRRPAGTARSAGSVRLMRKAKEAMFFLVFNPGPQRAAGEDFNTVVSAGIEAAASIPSSWSTARSAIRPRCPTTSRQKRAKADPKKPKIPASRDLQPNGRPTC